MFEANIRTRTPVGCYSCTLRAVNFRSSNFPDIADAFAWSEDRFSGTLQFSQTEVYENTQPKNTEQLKCSASLFP